MLALDRIEPAASREALGWTSVTSREGGIYVASIACLAAVYFAAHTFVPSCFDDCYDYIPLMGVPVFSADYWYSLQHLFRGFCIPLIYSLFGEYNAYSTHAVIFFQALTAFLSWIVFALAVAGLTPGRRLRWLSFMFVASCMFSRGYLRFDDRFLSDSIALSLMLVWLAIVVSPFVMTDLARRWFGRAWLPGFLAIFAIVTAMAGSARDANVLLMVCCTPIVLLRLWPEAAARRIAVLMAVAILFIGAVEWRSSVDRQGVNMANIIAGVVLPNAERTHYFAERGMPPSLTSRPLPPRLAGHSLVDIISDRTIVRKELLIVRNGVVYLAVDFVRERARSIYASYLLTHPRYVLGNIIESWRLMFDQLYIDETPAPLYKGSLYLSAMDWIDIRLFAAISVAALLAFVRKIRSDFLMQFGVLLALAGFANAVIGFHGDLWEMSEMSRHAWLGSTMLRIGCTVICLRAISLIASRAYGTGEV